MYSLFIEYYLYMQYFYIRNRSVLEKFRNIIVFYTKNYKKNVLT